MLVNNEGAVKHLARINPEKRRFPKSLTNYAQAFDYSLERKNKTVDEILWLHLLSEKSGLAQNDPCKLCNRVLRACLSLFLSFFFCFAAVHCVLLVHEKIKGGWLLLMQVQLKLHINIHG